jgi:hypothetical protein
VHKVLGASSILVQSRNIDSDSKLYLFVSTFSFSLGLFCMGAHLCSIFRGEARMFPSAEV